MSNTFSNIFDIAMIIMDNINLKLKVINMLNEQQIEQLFSKWYDKFRPEKGMAPAAFESFLAGWIAAKEDSNGK